MEILGELTALVGSLSVPGNVYTRSGAVPVGLPDEVYALALEAQEEWADEAVKGAVGPSPAEVAAALGAVDAGHVIELMTNLAADDLVFPGYLHQDRAHAGRAASRVVELLGRNAIWSTNIEGPSPTGRGWTPVTGHTFDGVIAGVGDDYFAILLQVGED
jgi:hypothetical protein